MLCILHTESSMGWGGQENRTLKECIGLKRMGMRVIIVCQPGSTLAQKAREAHLDVRTHPIKNSIDLSTLRFLLRLIKEEGVDIVSTHSGKDSLIGALAGRLSRRKPKIIRTRHLALPITSKMSYSVLPHKVVTVSDYVRDHLVKEKGIQPEKVVTIHTGLDLNIFNPDTVKSNLRKEIGIEDSIPLIGTVAILRKKKGHHFLLEAIKMVHKVFPEAIFLFIGDGPQTKNINKIIHNQGLEDTVLLLGLRKDIPEILKAIDIFILPTVQEALGTSVLEAMAMSKPVITTKVGGIPEIVKDRISGVLVQPNDPDGLAEALKDLITNKSTAVKLGEEARKYVVKNNSVDTMVDKMYRLYSEITKTSL